VELKATVLVPPSLKSVGFQMNTFIREKVRNAARTVLAKVLCLNSDFSSVISMPMNPKTESQDFPKGNPPISGQKNESFSPLFCCSLLKFTSSALYLFPDSAFGHQHTVGALF